MTVIDIQGTAIDVKDGGEDYALLVFNSGTVVVFDFNSEDRESWKVRVIAREP